jgi:hypothetical protein
MKHQKVTSIVYLAFSLLVAFYNIFLNHPWIAFFAIPFIIASLVNGKKAKVFEFIGLGITDISILFVMNIYVGVVVSLLLAVLFYTFTVKKKACYLYLLIMTIIVFIASYVNIETAKSDVLHSIIDSGLYFVSAFTLYIYVLEIKKQDQEILPYDPLVMKALDEAMVLLHESVDIAKQTQDDENGRK